MDNRQSFGKIFGNKGDVAPIAEKAVKNFEEKKKHYADRHERIHYFAVGHAFRQIDTASVFRIMPNKDGSKKDATRFLALQKEKFALTKEIHGLLKAIRNINSHYVHDFSVINLATIPADVISFITEAFELSCILSLMEERAFAFEDYEQDGGERLLVSFLCEKFYPNSEYQQNERSHFLSLTKKAALEHILTIEVTEDIDWQLKEGHSAFNIQAGHYLSFYACLFLSSMFLYKHEANKLVSKIRGFKRADDNSFRSKRNIFTLFAKKVASQDLHSEEHNLVRFRDMVQYLNHYPVAWNPELEQDSQYPAMTQALMLHVARTEICRSYPEQQEDENFIRYGLSYFFKQSKPELITGEVDVSEDERKTYDNIINTSPLVKNAYAAIKAIEQSERGRDREKKIKAERAKIAEHSNIPSPITERLQKRIAQNMLFRSYGRNEDRFMLFALLFLAETCYFGEDAKMKMYRFYDATEQESFLAGSSKAQRDKEKFHQGGLVHYCTYGDHMRHYPEWDMPYVIENNAIQLTLPIDGKHKLFSIQRALMPYLLQHALFSGKNEAGKGKTLLVSYHNKLGRDRQSALSELTSPEDTSRVEKGQAKKLLPSRMIQHYQGLPAQSALPVNSLDKIIEKALNEENRYKHLHQEAANLGTLNEFEKRNKGKRFKLMFVRKAWQLMYFSDVYRKNAERDGHHKRFHITRDEFNDFCRWIYAMDEVPTYKAHLERLLRNKGFFENKDFEELFARGKSLHDYYTETKGLFSQWLQNNSSKPERGQQYDADAYSSILGEVVYINLSHFISYLERERIIAREGGRLQYAALQNTQYLNEAYYYKGVLPKEEYKSHRKLFDKLQATRFEDALLYEIALCYLKQSNVLLPDKISVNKILSADVTHWSKETGVRIVVPFAQIDKLVLTADSKRIKNMLDYLKTLGNKPPKPLREACNHYRRGTLNLVDIVQVNDHILDTARKYTKLALAMERYMIVSKNILIAASGNRISFREITGLNKYIEKKYRNDAFHFNIPLTEYVTRMQYAEQTFLNDHIRPAAYISFEALPDELRLVCSAFLDTLYNHFYEKHIPKPQKRKAAQDRYFAAIIQESKKRNG